MVPDLPSTVIGDAAVLALAQSSFAAEGAARHCASSSTLKPAACSRATRSAWAWSAIACMRAKSMPSSAVFWVTLVPERLLPRA